TRHVMFVRITNSFLSNVTTRLYKESELVDYNILFLNITVIKFLVILFIITFIALKIKNKG
ncbi:hypothetical protein, partial [Clostridium butyricum]|uniref:hypothetical protein n=1 Tax=Clostridium butyricum TaxID=1492 RepID=UPI00374F1DAA